MPIEKLENGAWLHPSRLPLGCGWSGQCTAPGHEGMVPSQHELQEFCNLGYAERCGRLPRDRACDSVRFGARAFVSATNSDDAQRIQIRYVCERAHLPVEHGFMEFDATAAKWLKRHSDNRIQRMAECFLASYLEVRRNEVRRDHDETLAAS